MFLSHTPLEKNKIKNCLYCFYFWFVYLGFFPPNTNHLDFSLNIGIISINIDTKCLHSALLALYHMSESSLQMLGHIAPQ